MKRETINNLLGIKEAYEMPNKLMEILENKSDREELFENFLKHESDLSFDWFTDYFQNEQGDREALKQDFTPNCICEIISKLEEPTETVTDICSGTGGLFIKHWATNKKAYFHCEEISSRTIPILLFNMAIRGVNGELVHGDSLEQTIECVYLLKSNGKFSDIIKAEQPTLLKTKKVISNPPYSLSWNITLKQFDKRFQGYPIAPKSKADYAFILHGLYQLEDNGTLLAILPHGVLFRGAAEGKIREQLIKENLIDAVIGLPDKLFLNTGIPVLILVLKKNRENNNVLFIDASKEFITGKSKKQNDMSIENINKVIESYKNRRFVDKFAYVSSIEKIAENDYNLNIPRYVDTYEPPEIPDLLETLEELKDIERQIKETSIFLLKQMKQLEGTTPEAEKRHIKEVDKFEEILIEKYGKEQIHG